MSSLGGTGMNAEFSLPPAGFPTAAVCTRILVGVILASRSDQVEQDAQERELGYDLFSGPTVSASGPGAGTEPYPVHEGGCAVPNLKAWAGVRVQQAGFDIIQSLSNLS
jgi:hypothetical protein